MLLKISVLLMFTVFLYIVDEYIYFFEQLLKSYKNMRIYRVHLYIFVHSLLEFKRHLLRSIA